MRIREDLLVVVKSKVDIDTGVPGGMSHFLHFIVAWAETLGCPAVTP
jgi:hypothetical protein